VKGEISTFGFPLSTLKLMPTIRQLPSSVVNKIAAGEVIERPASVVKELVENSVDSGATRIDITVEQGGVELIRVVDNGCGIAAEELPLAVASHATSKIAAADDLFHVTTLGFRGEALASIAEVSRLTIRSRPAECEAGAELEIVGGRAEPVRPVGCPVGTSNEVRQLFFNTPVRHKFLRTTSTEMGHISEAVTRLALAAPQVHFSLNHGGRQVYDLPAVGDLRDRIAVLFDSEIAGALIPISSSDEQVSLSGYVANPSQSRGNNRLQYLMLNGRCIRDRSLQHALGEAYRGLLLTGRYPICFLNLELSPALVDVNVHPTKLEVRFQDGGRIYSQLLGTLRTKFLTTDLVARGSFPSQAGDDADTGMAGAASELYAWAKNQLSRAGQTQNELTGFTGNDSLGADRDGLRFHTLDPSFRAANYQVPQRVDASHSAETSPTSSTVPSLHFASKAIQIHNRYLVVENADGLEVIDQHALHERILYEQLRDKIAQGQLESQRLLVPEPVDLPASEANVLLEHGDVLAQLGLEIEPFGGETVLVAAYPAMLANFSPREVLQGLVEQLQSGGKRPESRDLLDELLHMIACKAAIKFGDRLTPEEVEALLAQRHLAQDHHHCPHGRPTALVFTREELDRQFKRI
jgi:DNA mismatch repair protein MutL